MKNNNRNIKQKGAPDFPAHFETEAGQAPRDREGQECPGIEVLADYAAGRLNTGERSHLDRHLVGCGLCLDTIALYSRVSFDHPMNIDVPAPVLDRVLALGRNYSGSEQETAETNAPRQRPATPWKIALRLLEHGLELLRGGEDLVFEPALAMRSDLPTGVPEHYTFERMLPPYRARFSVERQEEGPAALTLSLRTEKTTAPDSIRIELWKGDRLRASRGLFEGSAAFDHIEPGEYRLSIRVNDEEHGVLWFSLQDD